MIHCPSPVVEHTASPRSSRCIDSVNQGPAVISVPSVVMHPESISTGTVLRPECKGLICILQGANMTILPIISVFQNDICCSLNASFLLREHSCTQQPCLRCSRF